MLQIWGFLAHLLRSPRKSTGVKKRKRKPKSRHHKHLDHYSGSKSLRTHPPGIQKHHHTPIPKATTRTGDIQRIRSGGGKGDPHVHSVTPAAKERRGERDRTAPLYHYHVGSNPAALSSGKQTFLFLEKHFHFAKHTLGRHCL